MFFIDPSSHDIGRSPSSAPASFTPSVRWGIAIDADVFHRVRVGPINDLEALNRTRARLRAADIDAVVIRVGD